VDLSVTKHGQVHLIKLRGSLKLGQGVEDLTASIDRLVTEGYSKFVLSIADVPMIDSSGIGLLVRAHTSALKRGGAMKLVQPSKFAIQTLKLVGVLQLFEVRDTEADGIASFGEAGAAKGV
jgi:anti-anti-sigma factor